MFWKTIHVSQQSVRGVKCKQTSMLRLKLKLQRLNQNMLKGNHHQSSLAWKSIISTNKISANTNQTNIIQPNIHQPNIAQPNIADMDKPVEQEEKKRDGGD